MTGARKKAQNAAASGASVPDPRGSVGGEMECQCGKAPETSEGSRPGVIEGKELEDKVKKAEAAIVAAGVGEKTDQRKVKGLSAKKELFGVYRSCCAACEKFGLAMPGGKPKVHMIDYYSDRKENFEKDDPGMLPIKDDDFCGSFVCMRGRNALNIVYIDCEGGANGKPRALIVESKYGTAKIGTKSGKNKDGANGTIYQCTEEYRDSILLDMMGSDDPQRQAVAAKINSILAGGGDVYYLIGETDRNGNTNFSKVDENRLKNGGGPELIPVESIFN